MKLSVSVKINTKFGEAQELVNQATRLGLRDVAVQVHGDTIDNAKTLGMWVTGNNNRSIASEVSGMGLVATGGEGGAERMVDDDKIEAAVYGTSGYSGYLEVGHHTKSGSFVAARPYFKPSLDKNFTAENMVDRIKRHLQ